MPPPSQGPVAMWVANAGLCASGGASIMKGLLRALCACAWLVFSTCFPSNVWVSVMCAFLHGKVFMGGELEEKPKQGLVTQTLSKIVMSFAKQVRCRRLEAGKEESAAGTNERTTNKPSIKEQAKHQVPHCLNQAARKPTNAIRRRTYHRCFGTWCFACRSLCLGSW